MNTNNELLRAAKDAVYQGLADDDGLLEGEPLRARLINLRAAIAAAEQAQPDHKDAVMRERYPLLQDDVAATRMALHKAIRDLTDGPASDDLSNEELVGVLFNAAKLAACIDVPRDLMIDLRAAIAAAEQVAATRMALHKEIRDRTDDLSNEELAGVLFNAAKLAEQAQPSEPAPRDGDAEVCAYLRACVEDRREVDLAYVFQLLALRGGAS